MALKESVSDAQGVHAAVRGDGGRLLGVASSILRDSREAQDAVQETMALTRWRKEPGHA